MLLLLAALARGQPSCTYDGVDYSPLTATGHDYVANSSVYETYQFVFNVCKELAYTDKACVAGASVCERLKDGGGTGRRTDVYGNFDTGGWKTDTSGEYFPGNLAAPYTSFSGQLCQFGARFESRVYHICDRDAATPAASVVYESFYDCQVFVELRSQVACEGPPPQKFKCERGWFDSRCKPTADGSGSDLKTCKDVCELDSLAGAINVNE